jgi:7,8-dihydroneopterin aldolase/epimerase/oxygenase
MSDCSVRPFEAMRSSETRRSVERPPEETGRAMTSPRDRIRLTGLTVRGHHGVFDFERRDGQDFVIDVELELDTSMAAASDDVTCTVNYGELAGALTAIVAGEPVSLLETLAARLASSCLSDPRVERATVTVHKPQAPIPLAFGDVAVTITRSQAAISRSDRDGS